MQVSIRRPSRWCSGVVVAFALAAVAGSALAQTIDVQPGDTFSAIAARYEGDPKFWRRLYDAKQSRLADPNVIVPGMRFELVTQAGGHRYLKLVSGPTGRPPMAAAAPATPAAPKVAAVAPARPAPSPAPAAPAPNEPLVVGVLPNIAAAALMAQYESLKTYLERQPGGRKVNVVLPANFKAFFDAMMRGDFDIAVSAPHFARVAQVDAGLVPFAIYEPRINAQFIAPIESTVQGPADVRGKAVAFANPTSLVAMYGQQWLRQNKLEPGKDFEVVGARTDVGVGRMLLSGEAVAAIMSNGEFRALPPEETARLRIVDVFAKIPNFIVLAHPRLGAPKIAQLKTQWLGFLADKDDGAAFAKATGLVAIVDVDEALLRELDPYVAPTRRAMGITK